MYSAIGVVFLLLGSVIGCGGDAISNTIIVADGRTNVTSEPICDGLNPIAILNKRDTVQVLDVEYPKACMVYKVKLTDGRVGYVTYGDKITEIENPKNSFVVILGPTELLSEPNWRDSTDRKVLTVLQDGERGKIIRVISRHHTFYQIKLDDGRTGYVMYGNHFRVFEEQKK